MKVLVPTVLSLAGLAAAQSPLLDYLKSQPDLSILLDALSWVPELVDTLNTRSDYTILAPINSAFEVLTEFTAEGLAIATKEPNGTNTLLNYHTIRGQWPTSAFESTPKYYPTFFDSRSIVFNVARTNVTGGQHVGLVKDEDQSQIISGELFVCNVIEPDITVVPGVVIHKIDQVLQIPLNATDMTEELVATAAWGALKETDLALPLDIVPDLTLFIPNNEAFGAISSALAGASIDTVRNILQYHAVLGSVVFSYEITNTTIQASNNETLTFTVIGDEIFVNQARVVLPNVLLTDGVAHVIDAVLNPADTSFDRTTLDTDEESNIAYPGATGDGNIPFTSLVPNPTTLASVPPLATTAGVVNGTAGIAQPTGAGAGSPSGNSTVAAFPGAAAPTAMVGKAVLAGVFVAGAVGLGI